MTCRITYYLHMNDTKIEILPVIPKSASGILRGLLVRVGTDEVSAAECVRNLGVYLDRHLDMTVQVSCTISTCSLHLRKIGLIHRYLPQPTTECIANAMVWTTATLCCLGLWPITSADCSDFRMLALLLARLVMKVQCLCFTSFTGYPFSSILHTRSLRLHARHCTKISHPSTCRSSCASTSQPDVFLLLTLTPSWSRHHAAQSVTTSVQAAATVWNALPFNVTCKA